MRRRGCGPWRRVRLIEHADRRDRVGGDVLGGLHRLEEVAARVRPAPDFDDGAFAVRDVRASLLQRGHRQVNQVGWHYMHFREARPHRFWFAGDEWDERGIANPSTAEVGLA